MFAQNRRDLIKRLLSAIVLSTISFTQPINVFAGGLRRDFGKIDGKIIYRDDETYASWWASMSWYIFKTQRYPDIIVQVASEQDVITTLDYAAKNKLKVATRSSGHNIAQSALRRNGILLDLSQLNSVEIDPISRTAWVGPGVRSQALQERTLLHDLVFPGAHEGVVGLGGYLLGGGLGWNIPELGVACRSVLAAEVITADGKKHLVSSKENRELFRAVRGSGPGFFGVVTRYKLQLYPAHKNIMLSSYMIPIENMSKAVTMFENIGGRMDRRLEILIKVGRFYPKDKAYEDRELVCNAVFFAFADSRQEAQEIFKPVNDSGMTDISVFEKETVSIDYKSLYIPSESLASSPNRSVYENCWTDDLGQCLLLLSQKLKNDPPPSPRSFILAGWGFNHTFHDDDSCLRSDAPHYISWALIADKEAHIEPNYQWMDGAVDLLAPLSKGRYINETFPARYPQHIKECFSDDSWAELAALRQKYDPNKLFHSYLGYK